jgi:APA family basic amino acid/polyamine antiporter
MPESSLQRTINLKTATALVIGTIIGSGIFMRPAEMASLLGSPLQIMGVWVVAGVFTMLSVMVLAEVGAMLPEDGGQYAFMQHMYGDFWAYLYGWASFAVVNCAGTAGISFISAQYLEYFFTFPRFSPEVEQSFSLYLPFVGSLFPLENMGVKIVSILIIILFTIVNYRSTKSGGLLQVVFSVAKVLAILLLIFGLFFSGKGNWKNLYENSTQIRPVGFALLAAWVAACNGALQALDGCNNMLNMTGEIKDPGKNIPRALFLGLSGAIGIYLIINLAMLYVLPVDAMAGSTLVASDAAKTAFGFIGGGIIALLITISVLGTTQSNVLTPPRMTFAMARNGHFFPSAGKVHPRFNTPGNAMIIHLIVMILMTLSGSYLILTDMYIFIVWVFNLMLMSGLFILRKKYPDRPRPYRVWGYPWMPVVVIIFNAFYLGITLYDDVAHYLRGESKVMNSVLGLSVVAMGIPLYFYFKRTYKSSTR